jgi:hypothetical protein
MSSDPIAWALVGVPAGLFFFIKGFGSWSHYNTIKNTPTSKVEGIAAGFVEVYGEGIPKGKYLLSPFTGEECVFYRYTIEEYRHHGKHSSWDVIKEGRSNAPFFLQDETGKVEVDPIDAEFEVVDKRQFVVNPGDGTPERVREFLEGVKLKDKRRSLI